MRIAEISACTMIGVFIELGNVVEAHDALRITRKVYSLALIDPSLLPHKCVLQVLPLLFHVVHCRREEVYAECKWRIV